MNKYMDINCTDAWTMRMQRLRGSMYCSDAWTMRMLLFEVRGFFTNS